MTLMPYFDVFSMQIANAISSRMHISMQMRNRKARFSQNSLFSTYFVSPCDARTNKKNKTMSTYHHRINLENVKYNSIINWNSKWNQNCSPGSILVGIDYAISEYGSIKMIYIV